MTIDLFFFDLQMADVSVSKEVWAELLSRIDR